MSAMRNRRPTASTALSNGVIPKPGVDFLEPDVFSGPARRSTQTLYNCTRCCSLQTELLADDVKRLHADPDVVSLSLILSGAAQHLHMKPFSVAALEQGLLGDGLNSLMCILMSRLLIPDKGLRDRLNRDEGMAAAWCASYARQTMRALLARREHLARMVDTLVHHARDVDDAMLVGTSSRDVDIVNQTMEYVGELNKSLPPPTSNKAGASTAAKAASSTHKKASKQSEVKKEPEVSESDAVSEHPRAGKKRTAVEAELPPLDVAAETDLQSNSRRSSRAAAIVASKRLAAPAVSPKDGTGSDDDEQKPRSSKRAKGHAAKRPKHDYDSDSDDLEEEEEEDSGAAVQLDETSPFYFLTQPLREPLRQAKATDLQFETFADDDWLPITDFARPHVLHNYTPDKVLIEKLYPQPAAPEEPAAESADASDVHEQQPDEPASVEVKEDAQKSPEGEAPVNQTAPAATSPTPPDASPDTADNTQASEANKKRKRRNQVAELQAVTAALTGSATYGRQRPEEVFAAPESVPPPPPPPPPPRKRGAAAFKREFTQPHVEATEDIGLQLSNAAVRANARTEIDENREPLYPQTGAAGRALHTRLGQRKQPVYEESYERTADEITYGYFKHPIDEADMAEAIFESSSEADEEEVREFFELDAHLEEMLGDGVTDPLASKHWAELTPTERLHFLLGVVQLRLDTSGDDLREFWHSAKADLHLCSLELIGTDSHGNRYYTFPQESFLSDPDISTLGTDAPPPVQRWYIEQVVTLRSSGRTATRWRLLFENVAQCKKVMQWLEKGLDVFECVVSSETSGDASKATKAPTSADKGILNRLRDVVATAPDATSRALAKAEREARRAEKQKLLTAGPRRISNRNNKVKGDELSDTDSDDSDEDDGSGDDKQSAAGSRHDSDAASVEKTQLAKRSAATSERNAMLSALARLPHEDKISAIASVLSGMAEHERYIGIPLEANPFERHINPAVVDIIMRGYNEEMVTRRRRMQRAGKDRNRAQREREAAEMREAERKKEEERRKESLKELEAIREARVKRRELGLAATAIPSYINPDLYLPSFITLRLKVLHRPGYVMQGAKLSFHPEETSKTYAFLQDTLGYEDMCNPQKRAEYLTPKPVALKPAPRPVPAPAPAPAPRPPPVQRGPPAPAQGPPPAPAPAQAQPRPPAAAPKQMYDYTARPAAGSSSYPASHPMPQAYPTASSHMTHSQQPMHYSSMPQHPPRPSVTVTHPMPMQPPPHMQQMHHVHMQQHYSQAPGHPYGAPPMPMHYAPHHEYAPTMHMPPRENPAMHQYPHSYAGMHGGPPPPPSYSSAPHPLHAPKQGPHDS